MTTATSAAQKTSPIPPAIRRPAGSRWSWSFLIDLGVFLFVLAAIYGVYAIGHTWLGPIPAQAEISQSSRALPLYALYSLVRISIAYALSLASRLPMATWRPAPNAPKSSSSRFRYCNPSRGASFLPGVMLAMVALFPHSQISPSSAAIFSFLQGKSGICFQFLFFPDDSS